MTLIKKIISCDDIWINAAEDGVDKDSFIPAFDNLTAWFICMSDNDIIGVIYVNHDTSCTLCMHPYINNKFRRLARQVMTEFFKIFITLPNEICKLIVMIPETRKIVYNFAKKVGFIDEGFSKDSVISNGELCGRYLLGLTRKEIEVFLCQ
jgi:hypothetical protein